MKYLSIDIETTGLDPEKCDVLEIACIIEDTEKKLLRKECPKFQIYINHDQYRFEPDALEMNFHIMDKINYIRKQDERNLARIEHIEMFLDNFLNYNQIDKITLAGANLEGFDMKFLSKHLPNLSKRFNRRAIEPAHFFVDWEKDEKLPSLQECKKRAGIEGDVAHNALDDAWDVIQVLRTQY